MEEEIIVIEDNDVEEIDIQEENYSGKPYVLPIATKETLGGIKVGNNLYIDEDGVLSSISSMITTTTIYEGKLLGGESVTLENVKRFLKVYAIVALTNHRMCIEYTIDTQFEEPLYGSGVIMGSSSDNGLYYFVSEAMYKKTTKVFTHNRTGYFYLTNSSYTDRNDTATYYIYRIDTYDN